VTAAWIALTRPLPGPLVTLVPLGPEHEEPLWRAASADPEVWRYVNVRAGDSRAAFARWFAQALESVAAGREIAYVTTSTATGEALGSSRLLSLRPEHRGAEIGHTWLTRTAWGTGANTATKLLLLEHAFERLGCMRVEFKTEAANERSRAALAALPAHFEGVFRKHMLVRGNEVRDSAWYAIVDDEWPAVKAALAARVAAKVAAAGA
jgi:RimJ/RimL family protein N-acetyltransferase